jgi:hypothetical protein
MWLSQNVSPDLKADLITTWASQAGGYVLAKPGIPFFAAPKSILIVTVIVVEDHTGKVLTEEPHQITVIERLTGGSNSGLGFTRSRAQQMRDLSK